MTTPEATARRRSRYPAPRRVDPGAARFLSELPLSPDRERGRPGRPLMAQALVRCHAMDVPVESGAVMRGLHVGTLRALERHGLVHVVDDLVSAKGRPRGALWKPTARGLELITADEPRLLAAKSQHGYTAGGGEALRVEHVEVGVARATAQARHAGVAEVTLRETLVDEPEAVDEVTQKRLTERANATDAARRAGVDERLLADRRKAEERLALYRRLGNERGIDLRSEQRMVERMLDAMEAKIRRQSQARAA